MSIFKCLQSLRHSSRSSRLFQCLLLAGIVTIIIGTTSFSKKLDLCRAWFGFVNLDSARQNPSGRGIKEQAVSCFNDNQVELFFHASKPLTPRFSLPFKSVQMVEGLSFLDIEVQGTKWKIAAFEILSVGDMLAELSMNNAEKYLFPLIALVRDSAGVEYLIVCNEEKQTSLSSLRHLIEHCPVEQKKENFIDVIISHPKNNEPVSL